MIKKINQYFFSYNLNYKSEIAEKSIASKVAATRSRPLFLHGFHVKKRRKENFSLSIKSNASFACAVIKFGSASHFATIYLWILSSQFLCWGMMKNWVSCLAYFLLPSKVKGDWCTGILDSS